MKMFLPGFGHNLDQFDKQNIQQHTADECSDQGKILFIWYLKGTPALRRVKVSVLMRLLNDSQISDQSAPHDRPQSRALSPSTHCSKLTRLKSGGQLDSGEWEGYVAIARQVTT